jgi:translocation and assembly module TamA
MGDRISRNSRFTLAGKALTVAVATTAMLGVIGPASPQSFFADWFGHVDAPPAPGMTGLSYSVEVDTGGDSALKTLMESVSSVRRLQKEAQPTGESIVSLIEADWPRLVDALWSAGYYNATVRVLTPSETILDAEGKASPRAVAALEAFRNRAVIPLKIVVAPGPQFTIRDIRVLDTRTGAPLPASRYPPQGLGIATGAPAASSALVEAEARIIDQFRDHSQPLARITARHPVVNHAEGTLDISYDVDPGPVMPIGIVAVRGTTGVDPAIVRSFIYTEPGDPYSRHAIADLRRSIARIEALGSVRVTEADCPDPSGRLPLFVDVTERPDHSASVSARYSTTDGPGVRTSYTHRNLFGGAERLRLSADMLYLPRASGASVGRIADLKWSDFGGNLSASFLKPALWGSRDDLLIDALAQRDRTKTYTSRLANGTAAIRHRFSDTTSLQGGIEVEHGQTSDALGQVTYTLVGLPVTGIYDSTDSLTDPSEGIRFRGTVAPYPTFLGSSVGMTMFRAQASTYWAMDASKRYVIAAALGTGSIVGADIGDIPANRRFFAGGAGSVRGYAYRTLGPRNAAGQTYGGRSLLDGSIEARIRVTETIGIVPFIDAGMAYAKSVPDVSERLAVGAGVGLRYNTGIGPIRLDVATPLDRDRGKRPVVVYVGFGQAF